MAFLFYSLKSNYAFVSWVTCQVNSCINSGYFFKHGRKIPRDHFTTSYNVFTSVTKLNLIIGMTLEFLTFSA